MPINRLSPIIYDQLTGDKIFARPQLYYGNMYTVKCMWFKNDKLVIDYALAHR